MDVTGAKISFQRVPIEMQFTKTGKDFVLLFVNFQLDYPVSLWQDLFRCLPEGDILHLVPLEGACICAAIKSHRSLFALEMKVEKRDNNLRAIECFVKAVCSEEEIKWYTTMGWDLREDVRTHFERGSLSNRIVWF